MFGSVCTDTRQRAVGYIPEKSSDSGAKEREIKEQFGGAGTQAILALAVV